MRIGVAIPGDTVTAASAGLPRRGIDGEAVADEASIASG